MPDVKIISFSGNSAVVRYNAKTYIISRSYVHGAKVGQNVTLQYEAISTGTEQSLDWSIIIPKGITISPEEIQNVLYSRGIFTLEDMDSNPNEVANAIGSLTRGIAAEIFKTVHTVIGGT